MEIEIEDPVPDWQLCPECGDRLIDQYESTEDHKIKVRSICLACGYEEE